METSLLKGKGKAEAADDDYAAVRSFEEAMWVSWKEAAILWRIAAPVAFTTLFQYLVLSVTTVFVGHLGDLELSAISLSVTVISGIPFGLLVCIYLHLLLFLFLFLYICLYMYHICSCKM